MTNVYRVGDTLPNLRILVRDAGAIVNLTNVEVMVRWQKPDGTTIPERAAAKTEPLQGEAEYQWQSGDLSVSGVYQAIVQLETTSGGRYSLTDPPLVQIEVITNDFEVNPLFNLVPTPSLQEVASLLGLDPTSIDSYRMLQVIQRARHLTYAYIGMPQCAGVSWEGENGALLGDLVGLLAAREWVSPPSVTYGPYRGETYGSYDYQLRIPQKPSELRPWAITGQPEIDSLIAYFRELCHTAAAGGAISIDYPEWNRSIIDIRRNPTPRPF